MFCGLKVIKVYYNKGHVLHSNLFYTCADTYPNTVHFSELTFGLIVFNNALPNLQSINFEFI